MGISKKTRSEGSYTETARDPEITKGETKTRVVLGLKSHENLQTILRLDSI